MNFFRSFIVALCLFSSVFVIGQNPFPDAGEVFRDDVIPRIDISIAPDSLEWMFESTNLNSNHHIKVDMIFDNGDVRDTVIDVGFRLRGNTSRQAAKKSFKLSFNTYVPGREFYGLEKMNVNGEHNDPSLIRSKVSWDILRLAGVPAPRSNHVDLYINDEYYGIYINVEHIDDEFVDNRFGSDEGNLYKCLWPADLVYLGSDPNLYKFKNGGRRAYDLKTNTGDDNYSDIAYFIDVLNNTSPTDLLCELDKVLNVDNMIRAMVVDILIGNWDGPLYNKNNFYLYNNPVSGKFEFIPYDLDNTFGIDWFGRDWGTRNIYDWGRHGEARPLYFNLLANEEIRNRFSYYFDLFIENFYNEEVLYPGINETRDNISSRVAADPFRPLDYGFSYEDFLDSYGEKINYHHVSYGLRPFITARKFASLSQLDVRNISPVITNTDVSGNVGEFIVKSMIVDDGSVDLVEACFSQGGTNYDCVKLEDNGVYPDEVASDGVYSGILVLDDYNGNLDYYIRAKDDSGLEINDPVCGHYEFVFSSTNNKLFINEILADNESVNVDEAGENEDWIELYNAGDSPLFLGDKYLSDSRLEPSKWKMPDISIGPGEFLLFWADNDEEQGEFHTNFKLSRNGEFVGIFQNIGGSYMLRHGFDFGSQTDDVSFGSFPDGSTNFTFLNPTPGYSNQPLNAVDTEEANQKLFPNPTDGIIYLPETLLSGNDFELRIWSAKGERINLDNGEEYQSSLRIDLSRFQSGIYYISIIYGEEVFTEKIFLLN